MALVAGFAYAALLCDQEEVKNQEICAKIKQRFMDSISSLKYCINGDQRFCLPSTVNISFSGVDAEALFLTMKNDYAFSNGSACNSNSHAPSYVLAAMGLSEQRVSEAIRVSWNSKTEVNFEPFVEYIRSMA